MPPLPKRTCAWPGCHTLVTSGKCPEHTKAERKQADERRGTAHERGYTAEWSRAAKAYIAANPLCVEHLRSGRVVPSRIVDHVVPHRGDRELFWDTENWQALCKPCHDAKTARGE